MREILFRGRCEKSNDWICGDLIHGVGHKQGNVYIMPNKHNLAYVKHCDPLDGVKVIPETVGQFTGLEDKNKKKIFEGDVIEDFRKSFKYKCVFRDNGAFEFQNTTTLNYSMLHEIWDAVIVGTELAECRTA